MQSMHAWSNPICRRETSTFLTTYAKKPWCFRLALVCVTKLIGETIDFFVLEKEAWVLQIAIALCTDGTLKLGLLTEVCPARS